MPETFLNWRPGACQQSFLGSETCKILANHLWKGALNPQAHCEMWSRGIARA